jgi:cleavage and polyadenylation specificity factor subunit 4
MAASTLLSTAATTAANTILSTSSPTTPQYTFSFTPFLRANGLAALASTVPVCPAFAAGHCPLGRRCPDRHPTPSQPQPSHGHYGRNNDNYVCKHWLKALCKKGDACDYLHEYNLRKMSECQFYNQNGYCQNGDECLYLHVKEESRLPLCEDYNRGFCEKGPRCENRHVRRRLCEFYLAGFCPDGKECEHGVHLKVGGVVGVGAEEEKKRRERVEELDRRGEEIKREFGGKREWRGGGGRKGGREKWKGRRDRG